MKLKMTKFRIRNYRNINDSGWMPIENVTALVGCNESGKSALLKALHKFNPAVEESYDAQTEFPRDRFAKDCRDNGKEWPVCSVEFELADEFRSELKGNLDIDKIPEKVVVTKCYDGRLSCEYDPDIPDDAIDPIELNRALDDFKNEAREIEDKTDTMPEAMKSLASWVDNRKEDLTGIQNLRDERGIALLEQIQSEADQHSQQGMADSVKALQGKLDDLTTRATAKPPSKQLDSAIKDELPVFIYFDSYNLLDSAVHLPTFCEELTSNPADQHVRMTRAMFKNAELDEQEVANLGQENAANGSTDDSVQNDQQHKALRFVKLNSASTRISQRFSKWYGQRQHKIRHHADGNYFRILVSDDCSPEMYIELEERSKGFQWFFSFYTIFSAEADDGHKKSILLLDEPGLHLHPSAQQELLSFFEMLAEKNQIIYTTHSPYLVDGKKLHRVRAVTTDKSGNSHVSINDWEKDGRNIFPIQAAVGHTIVEELLRRKKSLVDRIKKAAKASSIELPKGWKYEVAQRLVANWSNTDETVPKEVIDRAGKLFEKITKCFDMISLGTNNQLISDSNNI